VAYVFEQSPVARAGFAAGKNAVAGRDLRSK
jgi:hypothetical protein